MAKIDFQDPGQVQRYLNASTSAEEWNARTDEVKRAHGGQYPHWWAAKIIDTGIQYRVERRITGA